MIVTRINLANLRVFKSAEFHFRPGFNLIVGVNGVGKTTLLDALGVSLSAFVSASNDIRGRSKLFSDDDIRVGADALNVDGSVSIGDQERRYFLRKPKKQVHGDPRTMQSFVADIQIDVSGNELGGRPLAVLFSTKRAVSSRRAPSKRAAAGGVDAAFADAFASRELRLREFGNWIRAQNVLRGEWPAAAGMLAACEDAVARFLPDYTNLRLIDEGQPQLCIDRDGTTIPVRQLSDGERGSLALVLDLTRRLAQANPELTEPTSQAEAVVLIDEIELHLHPKWQRQIVHNLTAAFPRCQFIATTHSPQVIGEVQHDRIQIIANSEVYSPTHSFGVDSSRVLEEIVSATPRTEEVDQLLSEISQRVGKQRCQSARELLVQLIDCLGENDPEVTRIQTLLEFMEGDE